MGGTGAIVRELVKLLDERQVPIRYNAPVTRIRVEGGRAQGVELANGEYLPAEIVVSNGDAAWTYRNLIEPQHRSIGLTSALPRANTHLACLFGTSAPIESTKMCRTT
jgi:phytoene desaturase